MAPPVVPVPDLNDEAWAVHFKGMGTEDVRKGFLNNLEYSIAKDRFTLTANDTYLSLAFTIRERLIERWILTQQQYHTSNCKRVYYLSMEFLLGRLLHNNAVNLGMERECREAMEQLGLSYEDTVDVEADAGLGNGGLGRLAACFLDSMATLELPAIGYGIRYEFGIFKQTIIQGRQHEVPEEWLQLANPWEIPRPEYRLTIRFYGKTITEVDASGAKVTRWVKTHDVVAIPYDVPVPGFKCNTVNTLRLWSARATREFDLEEFNEGDYIAACENKLSSENISKVLYPNDNNHSGKQLRLKQQYFFTSASLQDIIRRYLKHNDGFSAFPAKVSIQINDTHPAIAIVELLRLFIDIYALAWSTAWELVTATFSYTNHTLMPEALEKWAVSLLTQLLPRHMEIIYEINRRFLREVSYRFPGDTDIQRRMSLIEEGHEPQVRMAFLAIVGSHSVNGVAALHTELLKAGLVKDFYELWPKKFNNKTNGITPRRWLYAANPRLSALISEAIGDGWVRDLENIRRLAPFAQDEQFRRQWYAVKQANKGDLVTRLQKWEGISLEPHTIFDIQVKRIHEYKRQILATLHAIALYNRIKQGEEVVPRTILFAGKAAPGYLTAKLIVKFINDVASVINSDPATRGVLQIHFIPDYRVSLAEVLIPAADLSEQISTAGTEASGTGNMKFALNGALTIGTMDGANIEMHDEVGADNMFIFGLTTDEVRSLQSSGYNPRVFYDRCARLQKVVELINSGFFNPVEPELFKPLTHALLDGGDRYMVMADFESYGACQERVGRLYTESDEWTRKAILNVAGMGRFSSDRTISQYARDIWNVEPIRIMLDR